MKGKISYSLSFLLVLFLLLSAFAFLSRGNPYNEIKIKKMKLVFKNFSLLQESGIPVKCNIYYNNTNYTLLVKGDNYQISDLNGLLLVNGSEYFIKLDKNQSNMFDCDWIEVDKNDNIYKERFSKMNPLGFDLNKIPPEAYECDYSGEKFVRPIGKICHYFDV